LAFPIFVFAAEPKEFFLDGLKKLEQRSQKCVELRGEYVNTFFFNPVACFLYKAKDLSAPLVYVGVLINLWLFLFAAQAKEFFLDGLKKLEQRSQKCVWSSGGNM
jgi:hypothetical protein